MEASRGRTSGLAGWLGGAVRPARGLSDSDFDRLFDQHAEGLISFLTLRCGDRALAEDLTADAFERVLRHRGRFDRRRGSEKAWLYTIARNLLTDHARSADAERRAKEQVSGTADGPEYFDANFGAVEDRELLARAMATLSDEEREAVSLRFGADLSVPEVAKVTGEPLSTAEGRVYRALRKLREVVEGGQDQ